VRINYWTTAPLEPRIEAVSKEVLELATHFHGRILAVNPHLSVRMEGRGRVLGFNPAWDPLLRLAIPLLERGGDVNHVYGETSPWIFHKTLRRRPIVLTIANEKGQLVPDFLERCSAIVVQTYGMARSLERQGVSGSRVRMIYPGIDLQAFQPGDVRRANRKPRILLATFPRASEEMSERGVSFLLEVARAFPAIEFSLLSRPWRTGGTAAETTRQLIAAGSLANVTLLDGVQDDMRALYLQHDFTVIPFTTPDGGKECPRSLVETLACGVPVLISEVAPFSAFVRERDCGQVFALDPQGFASAIEVALSRYPVLRENAIRESRTQFDLRATMKSYAEIYETAH
jgi:glycosyltransferase involved in cell wall biosynthesis